MKAQWPKLTVGGLFFFLLQLSSFITLPNNFNDVCALENDLRVHDTQPNLSSSLNEIVREQS